MGEGGDVVEEIGAGVEGGAGRRGVAGVDGDRQREAFGAECGDDRDDAGGLGVGRDRLGAGAGGFAADVEDVGAFGGEGAGVGERRGEGEVAAAVGEAVGGDVEDCHQAGPVEGEAADRCARGAEAGGGVGGQRRCGEAAGRGAAAVLDRLGEPERAAGEGKRAGAAAGRRSTGPAGSGRSCRGFGLEEGRDEGGERAKSAKAAAWGMSATGLRR